MLEIPMTSFAATIHKPCLLKVDDELADLAWHRATLLDFHCLTMGMLGRPRTPHLFDIPFAGVAGDCLCDLRFASPGP